ncbi:ubiquitin carboxyl-terminal hydrolase 20-like isoform X5 [Apis laboriosa]|uniref:ubiquitin carboxyl-terminal hydrolase 20-like isoform X5 n=1 Tax=Apis laboriosa TaxID=183418 RepID=UPI001CC47FF6|nr:ubiquitin carboxyl-terminal hydrolase 20-like isoform X5 [Apis laboriosa]
MSYHRGGQAGAVAVSYSTSPMAPHSPSRRCSSNNSGNNSSAIGTSTSKLNTYRSTASSSILDRPTNFYSTSSSTSSSSGSSGFRSNYTTEYRRSYCPSGSFYSSTGTSIRRSYLSEYNRSRCSPTRSVSSSAYSSTGSGSGTATNVTTNGTSGTRFGLSTSSSSSSISAGSSSRDRGIPESSSRLEITADLIRYSPSGYIPNIRQTSSTTGSTSGIHHHHHHHHQWKHHSTGSSLTELFGGDDRDIAVERTGRDHRPESSLSSSSSSSSCAVGGALWSRSKRRPLSSSTVLNSGHARADSAASPGEVTINERGTIRDLDEDDDDDDDNNDDEDDNNTDDDQHNNNGNNGNNSGGAEDTCDSGRYGLNNNNRDRDHDHDHDHDHDRDSDDKDDDDEDDEDNKLNNRHHRQQQQQQRGAAHRIDEEGSPTNKSARNRLQAHRDERCGLNGLRNIGNTCFMNSVIQCLSNTRPLLEYLLNEQYLADINTTTSSMKGALIKAFSQVIHELWEVGGDLVVNTTALKSQIQRFAPRFMGYSQQDAQEFLRYLLEGLHEDVNRVTVKPQPIHTDIPEMYTDSQKAVESWKRYLRSEDSMIVDVFVGQLRSSLHCTSCDHVSVTLDPFWDLSLPIPARSGTVKLSQCLEHFTREEVLDGDEKPTCSKCQMRRKCTKSFSIQKFPKILVIHLKRFSPMERFRSKLNVMVDFPLTGLDLSAFAAPRVPGCTYNLYGVANHSGTTHSGHYTAYCKHPYSAEWHEYNDSRVSAVPARSVVSNEAYVLFYEQQPHSSHL